MGLKEKFDLGMILKIIALILCIIGIALLMTDNRIATGDVQESDDAMNISTSIYTIILLIMICLLIFKDLELDSTLLGVILVVGAVLCLAGGAAVVAMATKYRRSYFFGLIRKGNSQWIASGAMAIIGGLVMFVDCLKAFGVF